MNNRNLRKIFLSNNRLSEISLNILFMLDLEVLDLSHNFIKIISNQISSLTNLKILNMNPTELTKILMQILDLSNLIAFDLLYNFIRIIPNQISNTSNLKDYI